MDWPDIINGTFEILAGLFVLNHCRAVLRDKAVAGVSIVSTVFFSFWGAWNLFYYPHLEQSVSFYGGIVIMAANIIWVTLLLKYKNGDKNGI